MKLRLVGVLAVAAMLPPFASPQQAAGSATEPESGAQTSAVTHAVTPPKVSCKGNTLSISANYSALGAILAEVQRCTGMQFDAPELAKSYLVFDEIGPGPSNDVLASLLTSSGFDYILGASATDPDKVESLVLLTRADEKGGGPSDARGGSSAMRRAFAQMRETARPKSPEEQLAAAEAEKGDPDASESSQPGSVPSDSDSSPGKSNNPSSSAPSDTSTANASQPAQEASSSAKAEDSSASTQPAQDAATSPKPASPSDERIANMEKLFEQRRQMMQPQKTPPQPQSQSSTPQ